MSVLTSFVREVFAEGTTHSNTFSIPLGEGVQGGVRGVGGSEEQKKGNGHLEI